MGKTRQEPTVRRRLVVDTRAAGYVRLVNAIDVLLTAERATLDLHLDMLPIVAAGEATSPGCTAQWRENDELADKLMQLREVLDGDS